MPVKRHQIDNCELSSANLARHTWPFMEDRRWVWLVGSFAWTRISHRQRLMMQPVLQGKYQSDPFEYGSASHGGMLSWQVLFKVGWVPTWSWEGRDSGLALLRLRSCSTLVVLSRPELKIRIHTRSVEGSMLLLISAHSMLTHLTGKQCVGVEHAMLQKVGYHMPEDAQFHINFSWLW